MRGSYSYTYDPGFGRVDGRPDIDNPTEVDLESYRIKALWNVNDAVDVTLAHSAYNTEIAFFTSTSLLSTENGERLLQETLNRAVLDRFPGGVPDNTHEIEWTSLVVTADLGFAELTSSTAKAEGAPQQFNWGTTVGLGILFDVPIDNFTQEVRLVSTHDGPLQWLGGIYYHEAETDTVGIVDLDFGAFQRTYVSYTPRQSEAYSIYGEVSYEINDQWVVLAGLRYKDDEREGTNIEEDRDPAVDPIGGSTGGVPAVGMWSGPRVVDEQNSFSFQNWNPRINVTYYPQENGMVYLNAATAVPGAHLPAGPAVGGPRPGGTFQSGIRRRHRGHLHRDRHQVDAVLTVSSSSRGHFAFSEWAEVPVGVQLEFDDNGDGIIDRTPSVPISGGDVEILSLEWQANWRATDRLTLGYVGSNTSGEVTKDKSGAAGRRYISTGPAERG